MSSSTGQNETKTSDEVESETEALESTQEAAEASAEEDQTDAPEERASEDASAETVDSDTTEEIESHDDDGAHQGGGFASVVLKFLIMVLVVFALAAWLLPMLAPHLPASVARHLMPGQQMIDSRLAELDTQISEKVTAADEAVAAMQAQVAELTARLEVAEAAAAKAQEQADAARAAAEQSASAATGNVVAEEVVVKAEAAARDAAQTAATATTAATEAGKVASAATRDTASLARRMTGFDARLNTLTDEMRAINEALAGSGASGTGTASPEIAAAFAALQARVEGLDEQLAATAGLITEEDAARFATQDDLRSARTALTAEREEALALFPAPDAVATATDLDALRSGLTTRVDDLSERVSKAESAATEAQTASTSALGQVEGAIRDASLRSAVAALTSRMQNGVPFANALDEIERLTGSAPPEALSASASGGVVTPEWLLRGFGRKAQAALAAEIQANADEGVLGQASARLRSVVEGRPKNEQEGDDSASILSRVEARLKDGALGAALSEAETLPEASRNSLGDWLERLRSRVAAEEAAAAYIASLGAQ